MSESSYDGWFFAGLLLAGFFAITGFFALWIGFYCSIGAPHVIAESPKLAICFYLLALALFYAAFRVTRGSLRHLRELSPEDSEPN